MNIEPPELKLWAAWMTAEDLSPRSIRERLIFMRMVAREAGPLRAVTRQELILWMAGKDWANKTRQHYRSTLHGFFTWLQDEGLRPDNPAARLPRVKMRRSRPNPFSVGEIQQLLESGIYSRTRAMVALHYYLGLRVSEIAAVKGTDIDWYRRTIKVRRKGGVLARQPIPGAMWDICLTMPRTGYWFPNRTGNSQYAPGAGHILGRSVSTLLNAAIKRAGLDHRAHQLRAATATEMVRAGVEAFVVKEGMGHENLETTEQYVRIDQEQIRAGLDALPVLRMPRQSGRRRHGGAQAA